jgi:hypothetical protein
VFWYQGLQGAVVIELALLTQQSSIRPCCYGDQHAYSGARAASLLSILPIQQMHSSEKDAALHICKRVPMPSRSHASIVADSK